MRIKGSLIGAALVGTTALLAVPGGAASAATPGLPLLPITSLQQVIADGADGYVFLDTGTSVVVTGFGGNLVATLEAGNAPASMATDGTNVYVAAAGTGAIREYAEAKPGTLKKSYPLPAGDTPSSIAFQAGKIWVSYSSATVTGAIGYFTAGSATFVPSALSATAAWPTAPRLAADPNPSTQGTLIAVDNEPSPTMIVAYNVSGALPVTTPVAENNAFTACTGTLADLAVTANGGQVFLACTGNPAELGYNAVTLGAVAGYPSGATPEAIAIAPDNSGFATGAENAAAPALSVFHQGAAAPVFSEPLASAGEIVAPAGLSWTSDAIRLAAVLKNTTTGDYYLDVLEFPQYKPSSLEVSPAGTGTFKAGAKVLLKGTLTLGGTAAPAGITVKVYRQVLGSNVNSGTLTATTAAGGTFAVTDIPPRYGNYTYVSYYPSNSIYAPAWHQCLVRVTIARPALSLTASPASVKPGRTVTVTARLGATHTNRTVTIYARPAGGASKVIARARVNAKGALSVTYKVTRNTTFTVTFSGDSWYSPASATATVKS